MGGYPTLGARGVASPSLTGPPLALPLTRSTGTLRAEFPFRRITRRTPQFTTHVAFSGLDMLITTATRGGNDQVAKCRVGICFVSICVVSSHPNFLPTSATGLFHATFTVPRCAHTLRMNFITGPWVQVDAGRIFCKLCPF